MISVYSLTLIHSTRRSLARPVRVGQRIQQQQQPETAPAGRPDEE